MLQSGLTPLHLTAQEDKVGAAEVLAKYDANLDQQTKAWTQTQLPTIHLLFMSSWGGGGPEPTPAAWGWWAGNTLDKIMTDFIMKVHRCPLLSVGKHDKLMHYSITSPSQALNKLYWVLTVFNLCIPQLGYTPLIVACHYGNAKMVNFLLLQGASVNAKTKVRFG